jgi:hypothetical protein
MKIEDKGGDDGGARRRSIMEGPCIQPLGSKHDGMMRQRNQGSTNAESHGAVTQAEMVE